MPRPRCSSYGIEFLWRNIALRARSVSEWNWAPYDPKRAALDRKTAPKASPYAAQTNYRPSSRQQKVVLVFESKIIHSQLLIRAFREHGLKFFYLDYLEFMQRGTVQMGVGASDLSALRLGPARLIFRDVSAVIWDEPSRLMTKSDSKNVARRLFHYRWRQVLRDLKALLPERTLWLPSHPLNGSQQWQNKLSELLYAARLGLKVPESICTNDPAVAKAFIKRHQGRVLFRDFGSRANFLFRTVFADAIPEGLRRLVNAPCVFQRYVEKEFDVRAVIVGDRVFACRIDSQASRAARIDWRVYDNARVKWERMRLPREVERGLLRLMRRLDLVWGSADLVKGSDGEYYFLEVNRPGVTYWLLPFVGLDIPREIARYLSRVFRAASPSRGKAVRIPARLQHRRPSLV